MQNLNIGVHWKIRSLGGGGEPKTKIKGGIAWKRGERTWAVCKLKRGLGKKDVFKCGVFTYVCVCGGGRGELICDVPSQMKPNDNQSKWSKNALGEAEYVSTWSNYKCDQYKYF